MCPTSTASGPPTASEGQISEHYAELGADVVVQANTVLGVRYAEDCRPAQIGARSVIRSLTVIYADVVLGDDNATGHGVLIREHTVARERVLFGSGSVVDGYTTIGSDVRIQSGVYIPSHTTVGERVFLGPRATWTNDRYPLRRRADYAPAGPILEDDVTIGANATLLPGIRIGRGAMVAAGSVVTRDIPPWTLAVGVPARLRDLPADLHEENRAQTW